MIKMEYESKMKPELFQGHHHEKEVTSSHVCMVKRFLQIKLMLTEPAGSSKLNELLADILQECDEFKEKAHALAQMIRVIFHFRCTAEVVDTSGEEVENIEDDADDDDDEDEDAIENNEWIAMKIELLTASIESIVSTAAPGNKVKVKDTDPCAEQLVWDKRDVKSTLSELLVKSALQRWKKEKPSKSKMK
jgi:hypothetical protein